MNLLGNILLKDLEVGGKYHLREYDPIIACLFFNVATGVKAL